MQVFVCLENIDISKNSIHQALGKVNTPDACKASSWLSLIDKSSCNTARVPSPKVGGALRIGKRCPSNR
jgi:hypothetical protein